MNAKLTKHPIRALAGLLALTAGLALAVPAGADPFWGTRSSRSHWNADGNLIDVQVRVDGETAPLFFRPGAFDRHYFQAFHGRNYSLVVRNTTGQRVGVLIAVDGLNVVNGELSRQSHDEPMYVLDPYETATINGWRSSLDDVRRFVFVDEERSYAERTDQANGDLGWIRVLSFREKRPFLGWNKIRDEYRGGRDDEAPYAPRERSEAKPERGNSAPAPMASGEGSSKSGAESFRGDSRQDGPAADASPGTGWGERRHDPVRQIEFDSERTPSDRLSLRYEYASGLRALGIYPRQSRLWDRERGELGFAQPPRR